MGQRKRFKRRGDSEVTTYLVGQSTMIQVTEGDPTMDDVDLGSSVPDWLIEHPGLLPLFQELGIDYCCGGKSLETACREKGLSPQEVLARCDQWTNGAGQPVDRVSNNSRT